MRRLHDITGIVFNIQKFSVHDGPFIRDTIFLKGCPLKCIWCSNPESQKMQREIAFNANKCIGMEACGDCAAQCERQAIFPDSSGKIRVDREKCQICNSCEAGCCARALTVVGKAMTVQEVIAFTQNQESGWRANGGITISGGEPLSQAEFTENLLKEYRKIGVHTAIETTGFASWETLGRVADDCDLIFYDIKVMDAKKHQTYIGADNRVILDNLRKLSQHYPQVELIVRTPMIPGINDSDEDLQQITDFLKTLPHLTDYELLPYHAYGSNKYTQLDRAYALDGVASLPKPAVEEKNRQLRVQLFGENRKKNEEERLCGK